MNSIIINTSSDLPLSLNSNIEACGWPSIAHDYAEHGLDLHQYLIKHPAATFFVRAEGHSLRSMGILHGDLLIVDKSLTPKDNSVVLAVINGEFIVKRLKISADKDLQIWGVVTHAIHDVRAR